MTSKGIGLLLLGVGFLTMLGCAEGQKFAIGETSNSFNSTALTNNKVDILWVVDESQTMSARKQELANQVPTMLSALKSLRMDFHLAVTTMSMSGTSPTGGKFVGSPKYLSSDDAGVDYEIAQRIISSKTGSSAERAYDSIKKVLSSSYLAGEGKGFLRQDSVLVVVVVSDEDDISVVSVKEMQGILDGLKPKSSNGEQNWFMNYVGSIPGSTPPCYANDLGTVVLGYKYIDVVDYSKGTKANLCDSSLAAAVSNIKIRIVQILTDYKLRQVPNVATIVVRVNGVVVPKSTVNGWGYVPATNVIRFYGNAIPAADSFVDVEFTPSSAS